jgi:hypothetical protein
MGKADDYGQLYAFMNGRFVPVDVHRPGRRPKYPLEKLREGESFFVPGQEKPLTGLYSRAKRLGIAIVQRRVVEGGQVGLRVWRLGEPKQET